MQQILDRIILTHHQRGSIHFLIIGRTIILIAPKSWIHS